MPPMKRKQATGANGYVTTVPARSVVEDEITVVRVGGRKVILVRWEGQVYAVDAACPHAAADMSRGNLRRWKLTCREHDYCFDVRSGRLTWPEDENYRLRRYPVRERDGLIQVNPTVPVTTE